MAMKSAKPTATKAATKKAPAKKVAGKPKKAPVKKVAGKPKNPSAPATPAKSKRTTPLVFALPPEKLTIEDVRIEERILYSAPWHLPVIPVAEGMSSTFLAQLGAVTFRSGDLAGAARAWAAIPPDDRLVLVVKPWRSLALARAGHLPEALALVPEGEHLQGEILCALGRFDEGLAVIEKGREDAEQIEWRALREAHWLRRAGRSEDAATRLDARLEKFARFPVELHTEALRAWLEAGQPDKAKAHFDALPSAGLSRALLGKSLEDLDWLPHDLSSLAREAAARAIDIHFVDQATSEKLQSSLSTGPSAPRGVLPGSKMWAALAEGKDYIAVAESPVRSSRSATVGANIAMWLAHPDRPGKLYLCMSPRIPAFLWVEVDADVDAVAREIARHREQLAVDEPRLRDLPRRLRLFVGGSEVPSPYTGELEEMDFHTFARVAVSSPFLESYQWGGAHEEDPHTYFVDRGGLDGTIALSEAAGQSPVRPPMESYRTQHSRSIFSLEHHRAGWVVDLRYRPSPHAAQVRALNTRFGTSYPEDLPLDGFGLLMHFDEAMTADELKASVVPDLSTDERWRIYAVGALLHESVALDDWLGQLPGELQRQGVDVAWIYNHLAYLLPRIPDRPDLHGPLQSGPLASNLQPPETDYGGDEEDES